MAIPVNGLRLAGVFQLNSPTHPAAVRKMENILNFKKDDVGKIRILEEFEGMLADSIYSNSQYVQDHEDVMNAAAMLRALIKAANDHLEIEVSFTWEGLKEKGEPATVRHQTNASLQRRKTARVKALSITSLIKHGYFPSLRESAER